MKLGMAENGMYRDDTRTGHAEVFTAFCTDAEGLANEEVDVIAATRAQARTVAEAALERDYNDGMTVRRIVGPRVGLFL